MHLADAAFAQVERCSDFLHRQFLVVVEDDDQSLVTVQALGNQSHQVVFLDTASRVFTLLVLQHVDLANVFIAVGFVPLLIQADQTDGIRVAHHLFGFGNRQFQLVGQFDHRGGSPQFGFECLRGVVDLAGFGSHQTRNPVHRSQFVQHGSSDSRHAIRFKFYAAFHVKRVDGVHQTKHACRNQVV